MSSQGGLTIRQMKEFERNMPPDTIVIQHRRVAKLELHFNWNYQDVGSSTYNRVEGGVEVFHFDPEHGGGPATVIPISEISNGEIREAFAAETVDVGELKKKFPRCTIVISQAFSQSDQ